MPATPKKGRRFGGDAAHQKSMMANLVASLIAAEGIVTTEANDFLRPLHPRMPVILPETHRATWLDPDASPESLKNFLAPAAEDLLRYYPVSKRVNSARIDEPDLAAPAGPETAA